MANQKPQTKQPELIETSSNDDKKSSKCEDRKLCNGCRFFSMALYSGKPECKKGESILRVMFNNRPFFVCKDKLCKH